MSAQEGTNSLPGHIAVTASATSGRPARLESGQQNGATTAQACQPAKDILARVGDKWSMLVVMLLSDGGKRFNELRRLSGGISQRMLTLTLRGLERDGLVSRTVYPSKPPRVDYALTALGMSLREPIGALGRWAIERREVIEAARQAFDQQQE